MNTRESEDEQSPVLVSAHPLPKICQKLPFTETGIPKKLVLEKGLESAEVNGEKN